MTQETVRALADKELTQVIAWAQDEQRVRAEQRKHDTIAKIKEMAGAAGISVSIHGERGSEIRSNSWQELTVASPTIGLAQLRPRPYISLT